MRPPDREAARILVVDDEASVLLTIATILEDRGYRVATAQSGRDAIGRIERETFDLVLTDLAMKDTDGLEVLAAVQRFSPDTVAIMLTGYASLDSSIEAIRRGAYDYLTKPTNVDEMCQTISRGLEKRRLGLEVRRRVDELATLHRLANVGVDAVLRSTRDLGQALSRIAEIVGELLSPDGAVLIARGGALELRTSHAKSDEARAVLDDPSVLAVAREALMTGEVVRTTIGPGLKTSHPSASLEVVKRTGPLRSILAVPIEWQREGLGAMIVCDAGTRAWTEENVQIAATIASRAALAIANSALYRDVVTEKETLKRILDAAPDGIIGLDRRGNVAFFSRAAAQMTGIRETDVRGRPFAEMIVAHSTTELPDAIRARALGAKGGLTSGDVLIRGGHGEDIFCDVMWAQVGDRSATARVAGAAPRPGVPPLPEGLAEGAAAALPADGNSGVDAILTIRDARERRRLEEEKTNAFSFLTHELKTPLTTILTFGYLLAEQRLGPMNDRQSEAVRVLESNAHNLLGMIENMLATARISKSNMQVGFMPLRLSSVGEEARESFGPVAHHRGIDFRIEQEGDSEVTADRGTLVMAVNNLLANALKFTDKGGRITLGLRDRGADVLIDVHDTGPGIAEEFHERIFQRYFKMGARAGTGLGLAIVKSAAELHRGRVWVESQPGAGARFYLLIPKHRPDVEAMPAPAGVSQEGGQG